MFLKFYLFEALPALKISELVVEGISCNENNKYALVSLSLS